MYSSLDVQQVVKIFEELSSYLFRQDRCCSLTEQVRFAEQETMVLFQYDTVVVQFRIGQSAVDISKTQQLVTLYYEHRVCRQT